MSNILIYSGPGVSTSALSQTRRTLQSLCPSYDVRLTSATEFALAPWQSTASLVVIPGGRDLPYVEELGRTRRREDGSTTTAQDEIRRWVHDAGGPFVGICAGAYFASSWCTFEKGTPMEVSGPRPGLQFFPGECRGTVYKGFVYESDAGARVTQLDLAGPSSEKLAMQYNGGGAFMDAEAYGTVRVLARYPSDDAQVAEASPGKTYAGEAAIVHCQAGKGQALLFGTHPEFSLMPGTRPVELTGAPQALPIEAGDSPESIEARLVHEDQRRRAFLARCLAGLGLTVQAPAVAPPTAATAPSSADLAAQGKLTVLVMVGPSVQLAACVEALRSQSSEPASLSGIPNFRDLTPIVSTSDSNDSFHIYELPGNAAARESASSAYDTMAYPEQEDGEIDLHKVPKLVFAAASESAGAMSAQQRHWDAQAYLNHFSESSAKLQAASLDSTFVSETLGRFVQYGERVTSTQTMLDKNPRLLAALPSGFVSFATHQISGRGRGGNSWISPLGCLQFSLLLHIGQSSPLGSTPMQIGPKLVFVQYLAGIAIVEAIRHGLGPEYAAVGSKVRLKWPNDIYAEVADDGTQRKGVFRHWDKNWAKMGGILVNSQYHAGRWSLVVGCGINCTNALPTTSLSALIDEHRSKQRPGETPLPYVSQERLAAATLSAFERVWAHFVESGGWTMNLARRYRSVWLHSDQSTLLTTVDPPQRVRIVGVAADTGMLRAVPMSSDGDGGAAFASGAAPSISSDDDDAAWGASTRYGAVRSQSQSQAFELQPDGNSFDMLQNLIKTKLG